MDASNPFTPSFGRIPAHFAGRTAFLTAMAKALANERRTSPSLATILVGPRGTGKTALLGSIGQEAAAHGWVVAQVTANDGMLVDVIERLQESAADLADVEVALRKTLADEGASTNDDAMAAAAIDGFSYMLQFVGYWMWEEAPQSPITLEDAQRGIRLAAGELRDGVLAATYRELSNGDLRFSEAILPDEGPSTLADIAKRMGIQSNYASKYKRRLLESGVIGNVGQRRYSIDLPGFKEYVKENLIYQGKAPKTRRSTVAFAS